MTGARGLALLVAVALAPACTRSFTLDEPTDGAVRPRRDGGVVEVDTGPRVPRVCVEGAPVDLLFVVDNSNSMSEEQVTLAESLPRLFRSLVDPPDRDGDGAPDWLPVDDLQVGVVTTDMGTGGFRVPTCAEPNFGDDGVLRTSGNTALAGCLATYPPFLAFRASARGDLAAFARDLACVSTTGTGGCGFEQQLEAALKAVTPSTSTIPFNMGTSGHADRENMGFLRPDSLLAVVLLTDEEDCSVADPELFNPSAVVYTGDLNLRCFSFPSAVHPTERYTEGLLATRARPDMLVYAAITGIPVELDGVTDYDAVLADPRMQEEVDPDNPTRLRPSCNVPGRGLAFPPRRIVRVAQQLDARGASGLVRSICRPEYGAAVDAIAGLVGRRACARYR